MIRFQRDQIVKEGVELGIILQSGPATYDVLWIGGGTSRYHYEHERMIHVATELDLDGDQFVIKHLREEARAARAERRLGLGVRRGCVAPSR